MTFSNGKEMLDVIIHDCLDLYNSETEQYVFVYSDCGSICEYSISNEHAEQLRKLKEEDGEYWGAHLGIGGYIYDDPSHEDYEEGDYSNLDWCNENYQGEWEVV